MSQYILDCNPRNDTCTMSSYHPPPATIEHYALGPLWTIPVVAAIIIAAILAAAIVRYKAHEEKASVERERIRNPPKQCPTCGDKLVTT